MTDVIEFRGEQQAMSSKHTGIEPDVFNEYIRSVTSQDPAINLNINTDFDGDQSVEQLADSFLIGNEMLSSDPDGEPIELTPEYLEANVDLDSLVRIFGEKLVQGMTDRLRSGELAPQDEIDEQHRRLNEIITKRMSADCTEDRYVWFTLRRDGNFNYVDWPVASYVGHSRWDIWELPQVEKALTRLKRNRTITNISVIGKLPKNWYQAAL